MDGLLRVKIVYAKCLRRPVYGLKLSFGVLLLLVNYYKSTSKRIKFPFNISSESSKSLKFKSVINLKLLQ